MDKTKYIFFIVLFAINNIAYSDDKIPQNTINWLLDRDHVQKPRGGNTNGFPTEIDLSISEYFKKLQSHSNKKEKDRFAILSMIGEYRANFEFTEMYGAAPKYALDSPYKSWGTEIILPITNIENFISLQHILVMYIQEKDGEVQGPYVQKHWRQDWAYEDNTILTFKGNKKWIKENIKDTRGTWSQTVYQVDDSPRYESYGIWRHLEDRSKWVSQETPRPLPRREFSVRNDYNIINAINKISVMKWGWIMEEVNDKIQTPNSFIGSEYGLARYQRIKNYNFKPAYDYWDETKDYWNIVRERWNKILLNNDQICLKDKVNDSPLYIYKFNYAEEFKTKKSLIESYKNINSIINKFIDDTC